MGLRRTIVRSSSGFDRIICDQWDFRGAFPLLLGGEHGILLPAIRALKQIGNFPLENLTLVQVDAHADLRDELNGERFSHGTVVRRCLDEGIGRVLQIGVRAFSEEECIMMENDDRIRSWMAKDIRKNRALESEIIDFIALRFKVLSG